jgi:hypothetical protein
MKNFFCMVKLEPQIYPREGKNCKKNVRTTDHKTPCRQRRNGVRLQGLVDRRFIDTLVY